MTTATHTAALAHDQHGEGPASAPAHTLREARLDILALIALSVVTLGLYNKYWLVNRQHVVDGLSPKPVITSQLAWILAVAPFVLTALSFVDLLRPMSALLSLPFFALQLAYNYRMVVALRGIAARAGRGMDVSWVCWFLFGQMYLQFKINQEVARAAERIG